MRYNTRRPAAPLIKETLHHAAIMDAGTARQVITSTRLPTGYSTVNSETGADQEEMIWGLDNWGDPDKRWTSRH